MPRRSSASLREAGIRVEVDISDDTVGEKIRRAITDKHPAVLVVGDKDVDAGTVGLRFRGDDYERRDVPLERGDCRGCRIVCCPALTTSFAATQRMRVALPALSPTPFRADLEVRT